MHISSYPGCKIHTSRGTRTASSGLAGVPRNLKSQHLVCGFRYIAALHIMCLSKNETDVAARAVPSLVLVPFPFATNDEGHHNYAYFRVSNTFITRSARCENWCSNFRTKPIHLTTCFRNSRAGVLPTESRSNRPQASARPRPRLPP